METTLGFVCGVCVFIACQGNNFVKIFQAPPAAIICINFQAAGQRLRGYETIPAALLHI